MRISKDYYEAEVRDGFYVPSEMKRCWAATVGVLEVIDRICRNHGISYYAEYGTLLGAVRHGGFIPWDDDFDISMKREDYSIFLKAARDELPENYQLLSVYNNSEYDNFLSRVVNRNFISIEKEFLEENHDFPFAVGVDIFPLDHFEYNEKENAVIKELVELAMDIVAVIGHETTDIKELRPEIRKSILKFCSMCGAELERGKPIRQQIFILIERISSVYKEDAPYLTNIYFWVKYGNQVYKKECFDATVRLPFEKSMISAPVGYDEKLKNNYGDSYMTPYKGGGIHDYPLYGKQTKVLFETTGRNYYKQYDFQKSDLERNKPDKAERNRREVVFLPFRAKYWPFMEAEWERTMSEEDTDVFVIPVPYYDKGLYGVTEDKDVHYEADLFPEYVKITPFDQYDFDSRIPDRIVIQNPYDDCDSAITVHPRFYTEALLAATPELVYIPYFSIDDGDLDEEKTQYTADMFVRTPGVTRSDKVFLQSEAVRSMYIEKLCEFAGEDTRAVWEERLEVRPYIKPEIIPGIKEEDIPEEWWKHLLGRDGEGKKVILFHTSVSNMIMDDGYFEKLDRVITEFSLHSDAMTVIWHAHPMTQTVLESRYPLLWEKYAAAVDRFLAADTGIYDDREDHSRSVAISDAYYGDRDLIMHDFMQTGRPIMIMSPDA